MWLVFFVICCCGAILNCDVICHMPPRHAVTSCQEVTSAHPASHDVNTSRCASRHITSRRRIMDTSRDASDRSTSLCDVLQRHRKSSCVTLQLVWNDTAATRDGRWSCVPLSLCLSVSLSLSIYLSISLTHTHTCTHTCIQFTITLHLSFLCLFPLCPCLSLSICLSVSHTTEKQLLTSVWILH